MENLSKKRSLHRVKSFTEIDFDEAPRRGSLPAVMPEKFLCQVDVIYHIPPSKESILSWTNNVLKGMAQSSSKNLGDHLVYHIAARDWPEVIG